MLRAGGASYRSLAVKFPGLSRDQLHRHWLRCVSKQRRLALVAGPIKLDELAARAASESRSLIDYLGITRSILFNQLLAGAEAGDRYGVATIAGRLLENLRELGRLSGELRDFASSTTINQTNNVAIMMSSPQMVELSSGLLAIARQHPLVRPEIVALLRRIDAAGPAGSLSGPAGKEDGAPMLEKAAGGLPMRPGEARSSPPLNEGDAA
jgi:hypothetical protein